jgi:hypothetical protein
MVKRTVMCVTVPLSSEAVQMSKMPHLMGIYCRDGSCTKQIH